MKSGFARGGHDYLLAAIVNTVRFEGALYALHAFQKKSTSGIATPQRHIELVRQRLKDAETIHKAKVDR
jgi:phage-related protein